MVMNPTKAPIVACRARFVLLMSAYCEIRIVCRRKKRTGFKLKVKFGVGKIVGRIVG